MPDDEKAASGVRAMGLRERHDVDGVESKLREIAENACSVLWLASPHYRDMYYVSPAFERVWGRPVAEPLRDPTVWMTTLHPEDRERVLDTLESSPTDHQLDHRILRPDGSIRWVRVRVSPVRDATGRVQRVVGVADDVTEQKELEQRLREAASQLERSLAEKELLLREIHHRARNDLQTVASLLSLQSTRIDDDQARRLLTECRRRVLSMALVHQTLSASSQHNRVDFDRYIEMLLRSVGAVWDTSGRIELHREVLCPELHVDVALPCGLIVNELVTNAYKHAFAEGAHGRIDVRVIATDDGEVDVSVTDDGVGLADEHRETTRSALGLEIVRSLAGQLDGRLTVASDGGTKAAVRFPLPATLDDHTAGVGVEGLDEGATRRVRATQSRG